MKNPLFESLYGQARYYQIIEKDDEPKEKPGDENVINYFAEMGARMVGSFLTAIGTYPSTPTQKKFNENIPAKLKKMASEINLTEFKGTGQQIEELLKLIRAELNSFLEDAKANDPKYQEYLKEWWTSLKRGINYYELAIKKLMEYYKNKPLGPSKEQYEMLPKALMKIAKNKEKELEEYNIINKDISSSNKFLDDTSELIEKIQSLPFLIKFNEYNSIVNEGKRGKAKKDAKGIIRNCETLLNSSNAMITLIKTRESTSVANDNTSIYPESSKLISKFDDISGEVRDILTQLEDKSRKELAEMDLDQLSSQYETLNQGFNDISKEYNEKFESESKKVKSVKIVNTILPDVEQALKDGEANFAKLADLSQNAMNQVNKIGEAPPKKEEDKKEEKKEEKGTPGKQIPEMTVDSKSLYFKNKKGKLVQKKSDKVKEFQETVIEKYKNSPVANEPEYQTLKKLMGDGKGGYFGKATRELILFLEGGLNLPATDGNKIYKELVDAINKDLVKESFRFGYYPYITEGFDLEGAKKRREGSRSSSNSSSKSAGSSSKSAVYPNSGSEKAETKTSSVFDCIKKMDRYKDVKIEKEKATWTSGSGNLHTFNSNYSYSFYWKSQDKTLAGKWECLGNDWKATTTEDKDYYMGSIGDWKSNLDKAQADKAEQNKKKAVQDAQEGAKLAKRILVAFTGFSEDEEEIMKIFKNDIKTVELYNATKAAFDYWRPTKADLQKFRSLWNKKSIAELNAYFNPKGISQTGGYTLEGAMDAFLDNSEITRINQYLPAGVPKF
jgi:3-methyladenine DNA glycosylase AlkD